MMLHRHFLGWFGDIPLEASGDFGIDPEQGEYHVMCQVPSVEVNASMKAFVMKPLLFPSFALHGRWQGCINYQCLGSLKVYPKNSSFESFLTYQLKNPGTTHPDS